MFSFASNILKHRWLQRCTICSILPLKSVTLAPAECNGACVLRPNTPFFTQFKWRNFKNLPKSMAKRHQKWMCYQMMSTNGQPSTNYLYEGDHAHGISHLVLDELRPEIWAKLQASLPHHTNWQQLSSPEYVVIHGNKFRPGCILTLGYDADNFPQFAWLDQIFIFDHAKFFLIRNIDIIDVLAHVNAYQVEIGDTLTVVQYRDLFVKMPMSLHFFNDVPCICNKYCMESFRVWGKPSVGYHMLPIGA